MSELSYVIAAFDADGEFLGVKPDPVSLILGMPFAEEFTFEGAVSLLENTPKEELEAAGIASTRIVEHNDAHRLGYLSGPPHDEH